MIKIMIKIMVLKVRTDISPNIVPKISSCCKMQPDGLWKFDYVKFHELEYPKSSQFLDTQSILFWNKEFESVLNCSSELLECNRCGIPDTKENLDRGVEHSRIECEEASYYFKIYKGLSDRCREDPGRDDECLKELLDVRSRTKFQDGSIYGRVPFVLRNMPEQWGFEFVVPRYKGENTVSNEWKYNKYYEALKKTQKDQKEQSSETTLRSVAEGFGLAEMDTVKYLKSKLSNLFK